MSDIYKKNLENNIEKSIINEIKKVDPRLKDEQAKKILSIISSIQIMESYSGPLPKPEILQKYDEILPGSAERIMKMAEEQAKHRHKLEEKVVFTNSGNSRLGVIFAFILTIVTIVGGGFLIYNNKGLEGLAAIITAIGALSSIFIFGKNKEKKELDQKEKLLIRKM